LAKEAFYFYCPRVTELSAISLWSLFVFSLFSLWSLFVFSLVALAIAHQGFDFYIDLGGYISSEILI
jgi:hypothetical protein